MIDTFSGIGGFSLAGRWLGGIETVQFVEREPYCQRILAKHFPGVPIHDDICTFRPQPGSADIVCGGFPCQDISTAGRQAGIKVGTRSGLFYELMRVVRLVGPRFVVLENVSAIVNGGLDIVLGELAEAGFNAEWACIPASAVGACHRRDRWWLVAYRPGRDAGAADAIGLHSQRRGTAGDMAGTAGAGEADGQQRQRDGDAADDCGAVVAHARGTDKPGRAEGARRRGGSAADVGGCGIPKGRGSADCFAHSPELLSDGQPAGHGRQCRPGTIPEPQDGCWRPHARRLNPDWRAYLSQPVIRRGDDGLPGRVDRLKALGNAVVPQVAMIPLQRVLELSTHPNSVPSPRHQHRTSQP
jgi:DNA (cytosine-5)-methyltransferase 1